MAVDTSTAWFLSPRQPAAAGARFRFIRPAQGLYTIQQTQWPAACLEGLMFIVMYAPGGVGGINQT